MINDATEIMTTLNKTASEVMIEVGVNACTDVTGYGLLGHLLEMCKGSKTSANINYSSIQFINGATELASDGIIPGGTKRNLNHVKDSISFAANIDSVQQHLLADAQTSGGLLISVSKDKVPELQTKLTNSNCFNVEIGAIEQLDNKHYIKVS